MENVMSSLEKAADQAAGQRQFAEASKLLRQLVDEHPDHFDGWLKLSAMARATGDIAAAMNAVVRALTIRPLDFVALMLKATILHAQGGNEAAGAAYGEALAQVPLNVSVSMISAVETARARYNEWQITYSNQLRRTVRTVTALTPNLDRFITNFVHLTRPDRAGPTHFCYPDLAEVGYHPRETFAWLAALEDSTDIIAEEFEDLIASEAAQLVPYISYPADAPIRQWEALNNSNDWTAVHLIQNGKVNQANARHCPQLMEILRNIPQPEISGAGPNVMFSLLAPTASIPPHTGIANTRLVCHLPLIVPEGCWFRVGAETRMWQRGEAWVFDDTVEHEAHNPSDLLRVILIVDIWHPDLDVEERKGVAAVIGAIGQVSEQASPPLGPTEVASRQAFEHLENGDNHKAALAYQTVVKSRPDDFEAWNNLGNALALSGDVEAASQAFEAAIAINPTLAILHINFAKALIPFNQDETRLSVLRRANAWIPNDANLLVELGLAEAAMQNNAAAENAYRTAIQLSQGFTPAYLELGLLLENLNRIDALDELLVQASTKNVVSDELNFLKAWLLRRRGDFAEALILAEATPVTVSPIRRAQLIAELNDRLDRTSTAFAAYESMNREVVAAFPAAAADQGYGNDVEEISHLLQPAKVSKWTSIEIDRGTPPPVFIMGFPRSGTTLLDTLLMNVPSFHVMEELPVFRQVEYALGAQSRVGHIDTAEANDLRALYFESLNKISPCDANKTVIDKYPLHMARMPLIHRIFPDAKIIMVERHPYDVVLSCFMANFQLNRAMRHFTTLADAASLYDKTINAWFSARTILPLEIYTVRYENMIADLETEMRRLLDFLEVGWHPTVLDNRKAAATRAHIRTASYSQVTEPIYQRASGRWLRYRSHLEPIIPILKPWAERMHYET